VCMLLLTSAYVTAQESDEAQAPAPEASQEATAPQVKAMSGMSILGNEEAPKSLVIVPWKSSEIGADIGVSNVLDDGAHPVDKDVFMREVHFFEIRSGGD
jgi:hypothetical protein